jgi:hypothetical protein
LHHAFFVENVEAALAGLREEPYIGFTSKLAAALFMRSE